MKKILFVCTGNTCRSSMAEGIFNWTIEKWGLLDRYSASSAGLSAFDGDCANEKSIKILKENYGIDIGKHKAKRVSENHIKEAYLILTMTSEHKDALMYMYPFAKDKTFTLKEYVKDDIATGGMCRDFSLDIGDPYGMSLEVYKSCAMVIIEEIEKLVKKLNK